MCDESMQPDAMTLHRLVKATSVLNARYINAMLAIAAEIKKVSDGIWPQDDNPLMNPPHTAAAVMADDWPHTYSRQ